MLGSPGFFSRDAGRTEGAHVQRKAATTIEVGGEPGPNSAEVAQHERGVGETHCVPDGRSARDCGALRSLDDYGVSPLKRVGVAPLIVPTVALSLTNSSTSRRKSSVPCTTAR